MLKLDYVLKDYNLQRNTTFFYNAGDCLFDAISYLLNYKESSISLRINSMQHLKNSLINNTPKARESRIMELNKDFLRDLHNGMILNENEYIRKMSLSATNGGVWGDFRAIKWVSDYLKNTINVWNVCNGRILSTFGLEFNTEIIHIAFDPMRKHFEPIETIPGLKTINIPTELTQGEIIDLTINDIAIDNNDKYRNYTNSKSESSNSKEGTHIIQSAIIDLENTNSSNMNYCKYIDINEVLQKMNLQRVTSYWYNIGDCLFDSISYLLHYEQSSTMLRINTMHHLKDCLDKNTPKAKATRYKELTKDFLNDLHDGRVSNEDEYIDKMSKNASVGGIWGDFTAVNWISDYLSTPITIWNINSGYKLITFGKEFSNNHMHLAFDPKMKHFEPIQEILGLNNKNLSIQPKNVYENVHLDEESILQPNLSTSIKQNKELHTLEVMNVKIFESNLINKKEKEKNPIEKSMSKTIQPDFSNSSELKETPSNLCQLKDTNNHSRIIFRKKRKQRMYWTT